MVLFVPYDVLGPTNNGTTSGVELSNPAQFSAVLDL